MSRSTADFLSLLSAWEPAPGREAPAADSAGTLLTAAEAALAAGTAIPDESWHRYLDLTRHPDFLENLPDDEARERWAESCFAAVRTSGYTIETLLTGRAAAHPDHTLFLEPGRPGSGRWTYEQVRRKARAYAAAIIDMTDGEPRVAMMAANSPRAAVCDLACLMHGIPIAVLNPGMSAEHLAWICDRLRINMLITGDPTARTTVEQVREERFDALQHALLEDDVDPGPAGDRFSLEEECTRRDPAADDRLLAARPRLGLDDPATTMFTSGSTGRPKGVVFTLGNLVTKRFARAAALPAVGRDEVLLCYLPLFHTFGRYLEMLGTIFWGGVYAFVGNPSKETLLARMSEIRPTGLVSIPLRWQQIHDACHEGEDRPDVSASSRLRSVVGDRLRWGLSAAGYLDPKVFRFFQGRGVELCSGFGMTEATGGITMTPPGDYRDDSVGKPLPGARVRLSDQGELLVSGPYIARYLDPPEGADGRWLATGDLFREHDDGHLQIVDRIKDIYKNTRGQTIAPRRVEQKFHGVPGIRRVFLVGDHRDYNVLLIAPDADDPLLKAAEQDGMVDDYFHTIVAAANRDLPARERVVNFALLDRDFAPGTELTPKGTFRRKAIEESFTGVIEELYRSRVVEIEAAGVRVRIPRWFHRDLGILETDVVPHPGGLFDRRRDLLLPLERIDGGHVRLGDLEYVLEDGALDLGVFTRQPLLWVGNPALVSFCPVKDGWDTRLGGASPHVYLRWRQRGDGSPVPPETGLPPLRDRRLPRLHELSVRALFGEGEKAAKAIDGSPSIIHSARHRPTPPAWQNPAMTPTAAQ